MQIFINNNLIVKLNKNYNMEDVEDFLNLLSINYEKCQKQNNNTLTIFVQKIILKETDTLSLINLLENNSKNITIERALLYHRIHIYNA